MAGPFVGDGPGGDPSWDAAGHAPPAGRDTIADRVYTKIAEQAAATIIGVPRRSATVAVVQRTDGLALRVRTPLPVPSLDDTAAIERGTSVLDRVDRIQSDLRDQVAHMAGRDVVRVDVTVTGAVVAPRRRVL